MAAVVCAPAWTITSSGALDEQLGDALPLLDLEEDPLPRRPEREQTVQPAGRQELDQGAESVLVEGRAAVLQRRCGGGERPVSHDGNVKDPSTMQLRWCGGRLTG